MITVAEARTLINDIFEETALVIGGLAAVHEIEDDLVWKLIKNLDVIRGKTILRLHDRTPKSESLEKRPIKPHPAIEDFLRNLRRP